MGGVVIAAAKELDEFRDDLHAVAVLAGLLVLPAVRLEAPRDVDLSAFGQVLAAEFAVPPPRLDVVPLTFFLPLTTSLVDPTS